ncbi:MAG: hypothetical protein AAFV80_15950 [Bacteroidota bacterium]
MNKILKTALGLVLIGSLASCSVQQHAVNTETAPFENGGKVWGENTKDLDIRKTNDLHIIGINVKQSDIDQSVEDLGADSYTIETKQKLWLSIVTMGLVNSRTVKVIKRDS